MRTRSFSVIIGMRFVVAVVLRLAVSAFRGFLSFCKSMLQALLIRVRLVALPVIATPRLPCISATVAKKDVRLVAMDLCHSTKSLPTSLGETSQGTRDVASMAQTTTPIQLRSLRWANRSPGHRLDIHPTSSKLKRQQRLGRFALVDVSVTIATRTAGTQERKARVLENWPRAALANNKIWVIRSEPYTRNFCILTLPLNET